jgi:hypothetical protein
MQSGVKVTWYCLFCLTSNVMLLCNTLYNNTLYNNTLYTNTLYNKEFWKLFKKPALNKFLAARETDN